jgi:diaminopimelate decarboxylase
VPHELVPPKIVAAVRQARAARGGSPLCAYVYDLAALAARATTMARSLPSNVRLYYAVKANAHPAVLETLASTVHGFDIASGGELAKVQAVAPTAQLSFGGPGKTDEEIEAALRAGVTLINAESIHDLSRINHVAARAGERAPVLLRVNPRGRLVTGSHQMTGGPTQFGIDERQLGAAVAHARRCPSVVIRGLHLHAVSNNPDAAGHVEFAARCLQVARQVARRFDVPLPVVDLGGGMGIDYSGGDTHFDWDLFAGGLQEALAAHPDTSVILEPGRFLVAPCGYYAAEILDLKWNHGAAFAVLRGGSHHFRLPAAMKWSHPFAVVGVDEWPYPFTRPQIRDGEITVAGELCTTSDVLARVTPVERVRAGDILVFALAGAYGWEISHRDFLSHPHPDTILLHR